MSAPTAVLPLQFAKYSPNNSACAAACLVAADIAALLMSVGVGFLCKQIVHDESAVLGYLRPWPCGYPDPGRRRSPSLPAALPVPSAAKGDAPTGASQAR